MTENPQLDVDAVLAEFEAQERQRLGLEDKEHWTDAMVNPFFTAKERSRVTLLLGGLTMAHDYLVEGALKGQGYNVRALDCPDYESLRFGKEFGNKSQCNPTYFTVGNLVKELCRLRDEEGLSSEQVIANYVFMTAGACGPCRFGMYVTEYRKALRDAGFDGFRVLLFQQTGGLKQATGEELGLVLNPPFFIALGKALFAGDVINAVAYRIRPYEIEKGAADRAISAVKKEVYDALAARGSVVMALRRGRKILSQVEVDRTEIKPKVSVLGEFWAMTTEGDGNYRLQRFLEEENAECDIQLIASLLLYNLWEFRHDTEARKTLRGADGGAFGLDGQDAGVKMAGLWLGEFVLRQVFGVFARSVGLYHYKLPDMDRIAEVGHSHYNTELRGGEGHMEVAKLILNTQDQKAHMTLSVKPFGCMPSSGVSDGVQSVITELFPEAIFCAVETSGDGAVNFYSRVQMYLFKARQRAQAEMQQTLEQYGISREQAQAFLKNSPYGRALFKAPHVSTGTATDVIHHVAPLIGKGPVGRGRVHVGRAANRARTFVERDLPHHIEIGRKVIPYLPSLAKWIANEAVSLAPGADSVRAALTKTPQAAKELLPKLQRKWNRCVDVLFSAEQASAVPEAAASDKVKLPIAA